MDRELLQWAIKDVSHLFQYGERNYQDGLDAETDAMMAFMREHYGQCPRAPGGLRGNVH